MPKRNMAFLAKEAEKEPSNLPNVRLSARAEECDCCKALLEGIADILHNQETQRSPIAAYGLTEDCQMRAAAKVLRHIATALIVRKKNILEGKV